jgi:hypothetical protein
MDFFCLTVLSSEEFLDPLVYHPVDTEVVFHQKEYNPIALPGRLPRDLNKKIPPCDHLIGDHILAGGGILLA